MKASRIFSAAALAALVILSAGCKKHQWRPEPGSQIRFRAVSDASARPAETKTAYSGKYFASETAGQYVERVDWVEGDRISVGYVVRTGSDFTYAGYDNYAVSSVTASDVKSNATLVPADGNGLKWQEGTYHGFYGTYPTCTDLDGFQFDIVDNAVKYSVPCEYPKEQVVTLSAGKEARLYNGDLLSEKVYDPDMKYAWFLANGSWTGQGGTINLSFESHVTTFEFTVDCAEDVEESLTIASFEMEDANVPLSGTCLWSVDSEGQTSDTPAEDVSKKVKVWFNADHDPITLEKGKPITFSVLTPCTHDKKAVTITFNLLVDGASVPRKLKLKTNAETGLNVDGEGEKNYGITFGSSLKHRIFNLFIPQALTPDGWFEATDAGGYTNQDW